MTEEQFDKFLLAMANSDHGKEEPVTVKHDLVDSLSKIGVALCTAAILWVAAQMQGLTTDMAIMQTNMNTVAQFMDDPKFTESMNSAADQAMLAQIKDLFSEVKKDIGDNTNEINNVKIELNRRSDFIDATLNHKKLIEERLGKVELKVNSFGINK